MIFFSVSENFEKFLSDAWILHAYISQLKSQILNFVNKVKRSNSALATGSERFPKPTMGPMRLLRPRAAKSFDEFHSAKHSFKNRFQFTNIIIVKSNKQTTQTSSETKQTITKQQRDKICATDSWVHEDRLIILNSVWIVDWVCKETENFF